MKPGYLERLYSTRMSSLPEEAGLSAEAMKLPVQVIITNLDGLESSILTDAYVYRWFTHLVTQLSFKKRSLGLTKIEDDYRRITLISRLQRVCGLAAVILFLFYFQSKQLVIVPVFFLAGYFIFKLRSKKKACVTRISIHFIREDFEPEVLKRTTLYQMSELYSQKYGILSLVDAIYHSDKIYRFTLWAFFFSVFYGIRLCPRCSDKYLLFIGLYIFMISIINSSFVYKRFK